MNVTGARISAWMRAARRWAFRPWTRDPIGLAARLGAGLLSLNAIWLVARVMIGRVGYPFDLEWMEGTIVDHAFRLLHGQPIYTRPSFAFTPCIYNPFYYALGAASMAVLGPGPVALRVVSALATLVLCAGAAILVRRDTHSGFAGLVTCGAFLATYELSGGWMDIARVDTTFLALEVAAVLAAASRRLRGAVLAGLLTCCAFLTKQPAALVVVPILAGALVDRRWSHAAAYAGTTGVAIAGSIGLLQWATGGWFWFWTELLPLHHYEHGYDLAQTFQLRIVQPLGALLVVAAGGVMISLARLVRPPFFAAAPAPATAEARRSAATLLAFAAVLAIQAWMSFNHAGSYDNCLMPAHLALALLAGVALGHAARLPSAGQLVGLVAVSLQLYQLAFPPEKWIPNDADRAAGAGWVKELERARGTTLIPFRGFFYAPGLNPAHATQMPAGDLFQPAEDLLGLEAMLRAETERIFASGRYRRIWLDENDFVFMRELEAHYQRVSEAPGGRFPFSTRTGPPMRPRILYEFRRDLAPPVGPR